uniref:Uncharacterized protein n=1 Tax=Setaria italica TaxID=4555 RepID=K4ANU4_SETIT
MTVERGDKVLHTIGLRNFEYFGFITNMSHIAIAINGLSMLLIVFMALSFIILWLHVTIMNKVTGVVR